MNQLGAERNVLLSSCVDEYCLNTFATLRQNGTFTDCCIVLDDGSRFKAHKIILCSSSDYFRTAFSECSGDSFKAYEVFLANIQHGVMENIINYIYSRHIVISEDNVLDLFAASNRLQISNIIQVSANYIETKMLNERNCVQLMRHVRNNLEFGQQPQEPQRRLHARIRRYVLENFTAVARGNSLLELSVDEFCDLIRDDRLNAKDEVTVWTCCRRWLDYDAINRMPFISRLLKAVRLGLLDKTYFKSEVMHLPALQKSYSARSLIKKTIQFWDSFYQWPTTEYDADDALAQCMIITPTPAFALPRIPTEVVIVVGGLILNYNNVLMESYDLRADKWLDLPFSTGTLVPAGDSDPCEMAVTTMTRCYHASIAIGFKIFCIGGFDGCNYLSQCMMFDARTKRWQEIAPMHQARCHVAATEYDGRIYVMGGYDGSVRLRTMEMYDPATNQWTMLPSMHYCRSDGAACTLHGRIYAIGGFSGSMSRDVAEYYDPTANCWQTIDSMITRRSGLGCVAYRGYLYAVGGFDGLERLSTMEKYDPVSNVWHAAPEMITARSNFGLTIADDLMFAIGGFDGFSILTETECYNFDDGEWIDAENLNHPRLALTACTICGIPNLQEYTYPHRENLLMDRRNAVME